MRPHISQREAQYLSKILQNENILIRERIKKVDDLCSQIIKLKAQWKITNDWQTWKQIKPLQEELNKLITPSIYDLSKALMLNTALSHKYAILPDKKKGGRYPFNACAHLYPDKTLLVEALEEIKETVQ